MLNETSQSQKGKHCMIPLIQSTHNSQTQKGEWGLLEAGGGERSQLWFRSEFQLGMTRNFWRGMVVRAAHLGELHLMPLHFVL